MAKQKSKIDFAKADQQLDKMLKRKLNIVGAYLVGQAVMNIVNNKSVDTGLLANSITQKVINKEGSMALIIGTDTEYAWFVEFGTGIHAENGKGRKTAWVTPLVKVGGQWKHFKTVGQEGKPFLRPLLKKQDQVEYILARA